MALRLVADPPEDRPLRYGDEPVEWERWEPSPKGFICGPGVSMSMSTCDDCGERLMMSLGRVYGQPKHGYSNRPVDHTLSASSCGCGTFVFDMVTRENV